MSRPPISRVAATALAVIAGCATEATTDAPLARNNDRFGRVVSNYDGLEVRQWAIVASAEHIERTLTGYADGAAAGPDVLEQLRRNGLRLVRVRHADLASLRQALGVAVLNLTAWHGQVYEWRELLQRRLGQGATTVAVDGHVRRYDPQGSMRLMARAFTVPMEDGPYLSLEVVPVYERPQGRLGRLLGPEGLSGEILPSLRIELSLTPGHAWVLTRAIIRNESASAFSDDAPPGPAVATPPTVGELLFSSQSEPPTSGLLIFVPEIIQPQLEEAAGQAPRPPVESSAPGS